MTRGHGNFTEPSYLRPGALGLWLVTVRPFVITLQHGGRDVGASGPLAAWLPGMRLITVQPGRVGLHNLSGLTKEQA